MKDLYIVTNDPPDKIIWSLSNSPIDLLTLLVKQFKSLVYHLKTYEVFLIWSLIYLGIVKD